MHIAEPDRACELGHRRRPLPGRRIHGSKGTSVMRFHGVTTVVTVAMLAAADGSSGQCGISPNRCFAEHSGVGCAEATCCQAVCSCDAFCCNVQWDEFCAGEGFGGSGCGASELCTNPDELCPAELPGHCAHSLSEYEMVVDALLPQYGPNL